MQYRALLTKISQNASVPSTEKKDTYSYLIKDLEPKTTYMIRVGAKNRHGTNFNEEKAYETLAPRKLLDYLIIIQTLYVTLHLFFQTCLVNFLVNYFCFNAKALASKKKHVLLIKPETMLYTNRPGLCIKTRLSA